MVVTIVIFTKKCCGSRCKKFFSLPIAMYGLHQPTYIGLCRLNKGVHTMKNSNVIGIDLAKHVIKVCKIDKHGELISNKASSQIGRASCRERV